MKIRFFSLSVSCFFLFTVLTLFPGEEKRNATGALTVAHRGFCMDCRENTMASLLAAKLMGADYAEMDIHLTADGVLVVSHDSSLQKAFGVDKTIENSGFAELRSDTNEKLPTLEEMFTFAERNNLPLMIEIKEQTNGEELVRKLLCILQNGQREQNCILACQTYKVLQKIKKENPKITTAFILRVAPCNVQTMTDADVLCIRKNCITEKLIRQMHQWDKSVFAWTVNDRQEQEILFGWGIDGVITDRW